jgi:hypothetical protein
MVKKIVLRLLLPTLFLLFYTPLFAQPTQTKLTENLIIEGRVISKYGMLLLITSDGKGYLLKKTEGTADIFNKIKEFVNQDFDLNISGRETGVIKSFKHTDFRMHRAFIEDYNVLEVLRINEVKKGSKVSKINISKPTTVERPQNFLSLLIESIALKKIEGKINKCNFKSAIPTIELEETTGVTFLLSQNTYVVKLVDGEPMPFQPTQKVIKKGMQVEILYQEIDNLKRARIINIKKEN